MNLSKKWHKCLLICGTVFSLAVGTTLFSCSQSHILHTQEQVSRDYTYVDFVRNQASFEMRGSVGGEHINSVKIIGFQGDKFLIEFTNVKGRVNFDVAGTGTEYKKNGRQSGTILIRDLEAIATIETSAHPSADYILRITPLKLQEEKKFSLFFWQD